MKRDNINYLMVGVFVIAMAVAFFVLMYHVTGSTGPTDTYRVVYKNVSGLKFGTGVYYEGYHVGQVENILPQHSPNGMRYELRLSIVRGWEIPDDSVAKIVSSGLISAVQIHISEGHSEVALAPGGLMAGEENQSIFAVLNNAAGQFQTLAETGVMPVLKNLNNRIDLVSEEILGFQQQQLRPLVDTFNQRLNGDLLGQAQSVIEKLDNSAQQLERILGSRNQENFGQFLLHIDDVAISLKSLIERIETTRLQMGDTLVAFESLAAENDAPLASAVRNADASMQQMRSALRTFNEDLDTILHNVEGGTRQMHEFARALRDNPARLIRGTEAQDDAR